MKHSESLADTKLWREYCKKITNETDAEERRNWISNVFSTTESLLKAVRDTFPNYTLHDRVHILNVVDCMGGVLGTYIPKLSVGEMEVLILSAALHDLGMVYNQSQREAIFQNEKHIASFEARYNRKIDDCSDDLKQDYLRYLHPFRISDVVESNERLKTLFDEMPQGIVAKESLYEVCKSHGLEADAIMSRKELAFLEYESVDLRFCSFLLRLSDLLDFDNSRSPSALFNLTPLNEKSEEEWLKHLNSKGFNFPKKPSTNELPYKAVCKDPNLEHVLKRFLNSIDEELINCHRNQNAFNQDWQKTFPFPWKISRSGILPKGYESGDFLITMDQQRILELFTGENLYSDDRVFIRELLQNSIDAIQLRAEFDKCFSLENAKIDIWEWMDDKGVHWFRIDDNGTGMTVDIIKKFFLKVGNSYYTSDDIKRDWCRYNGINNSSTYRGISQFGIGFLSCFLCSDYIEVSTKYFDEHIGYESHAGEPIMPRRNGLKLSITGLNGYYILNNEASGHPSNLMPSHPLALENSAYRNEPGTSILLRINNSFIGDAESYICDLLLGTPVPVFYNGVRTVATKDELHKKTCAISEKNQYPCFSQINLKDQINKLNCRDEIKAEICKSNLVVKTNTILLTKNKNGTNDFCGYISSYRLNGGEFKIHNAEYDCDIGYYPSIDISHNNYCIEWSPDEFELNPYLDALIRSFDYEYREYLSDIVGSYNSYSHFSEEFERDLLKSVDYCDDNNIFVEALQEHNEYLEEIWRIKTLNSYESVTLNIDNDELLHYFNYIRGIPLRSFWSYGEITFAYNGIIVRQVDSAKFSKETTNGVILLDGEEAPKVNIARNTMVSLPLITWLRIFADYCIDESNKITVNPLSEHLYFFYSLDEWEKNLDTDYGSSLYSKIESYISEFANKFDAESVSEHKRTRGGRYYLNDMEKVYRDLVYTLLIMHYEITIEFGSKQIIRFTKAEKKYNPIGDLSPAILPCLAKTKKDEQYICSEDKDYRLGYNMNHPFIVWLSKNRLKLIEHYSSYYYRICSKIEKDTVDEIIDSVNSLYDYSRKIPRAEWKGVEFDTLEKIGEDDFWHDEL